MLPLVSVQAHCADAEVALPFVSQFTEEAKLVGNKLKEYGQMVFRTLLLLLMYLSCL